MVAEAFRSITANVSTTAAATVTVLIGMFLVGVLIAFGSWARSWSEHTKDQLLVKVFFCTELDCRKGQATTKQIEAVHRALDGNPLVKSVNFVSKQEAFELMRRKYPELTANVPANPLPASWEILPKRGEDTEEIADGLKPLPKGVKKVSYGEKKANRILSFAGVIEAFFAAGIGILLIASTLLIANTIRLSIFARRREIEVMKLVGASNWFVRGPFMLEGLLCGLIGSAAAVVLLLLGKEFALPALPDWLHEPGVESLAFELNALILVGMGLLLGAAGSGLTLRRFLRV
jgi:cell division transport system permease protein